MYSEMLKFIIVKYLKKNAKRAPENSGALLILAMNYSSNVTWYI